MGVLGAGDAGDGPRPKRLVALRAAALAAATLTTISASAAGPGIGNVSYEASELLAPIASFDASNGAVGGTNVPLLIDGYLLLHFAPDSGQPGTGLALYDLSDPRAPKLVKSVTDEHTAVLRETHSLPIARIAGKKYVVFQATRGIQFWDFTDPLSPFWVSDLELAGTLDGDYFNAVWMTSWQGAYVFVGGTNNGTFFIDAHDPAQPTLIARLEIAQTGVFLVGPVYALGDRLVISSMTALFPQYSLIDIRDPAAPFMVSTFNGPGGQLYSSMALGERIYGIGRNLHFTVISRKDDVFEVLADVPEMGPGSYASIQDQFLHYGGKEYYQKLDLTDEAHPQVVGKLTIPKPNIDHGQAWALGNLVYIGNDHATGSVLAPHQLEPDTTPPRIVAAYPADGATNVATTSRVGISFSDNIDFASVGPESISVTKLGGEPVDGIYSYWANTVSFGASAGFEKDAAYRVVVKADGVRDVVGNPITSESAFVFSTGTSFADAGSGAGGTGQGGGTPGAGTTGAGAGESGDSGCGCRAPGSDRSGHGSGLLALVLAAWGVLSGRRPTKR